MNIVFRGTQIQHHKVSGPAVVWDERAIPLDMIRAERTSVADAQRSNERMVVPGRVLGDIEVQPKAASPRRTVGSAECKSDDRPRLPKPAARFAARRHKNAGINSNLRDLKSVFFI